MFFRKAMYIISRVISALIILLFLTVCIVTSIVYLQQDSLIFEMKKINKDFVTAIPPNFETMYFTTAEKYIYKCWLIKTSHYQDKPTIQYILGNGAYMENYIKVYKTLSEKLDVNILGCSTRGSGTYEGTPTEETLYADAQMHSDVLRNMNFKHLFVHGRSLGGAVAIEMAYKNPGVYAGVVVENTLLSLKQISKERYPILYFFIFSFDWIVRTKLQNNVKIRSVVEPTLFVVSLKDEVINPKHTQTLYQLSASPYKYLYISKEGTHSHAELNDETNFYQIYKDFIQISIKIAEKKLERENRIHSVMDLASTSQSADEIRTEEKLRGIHLRSD